MITENLNISFLPYKPTHHHHSCHKWNNPHSFLPVNATVDATNAEAVVELLTYCQLEIGIDVEFGVDGHTGGE